MTWIGVSAAKRNRLKGKVACCRRDRELLEGCDVSSKNKYLQRTYMYMSKPAFALGASTSWVLCSFPYSLSAKVMEVKEAGP